MVFPGGGEIGGALRWRLSLNLPHHGQITTSKSARTDNLQSSNGDGDHAANPKRPIKRFPLKAALTSGVLALLGDTAAQLRSRWISTHSDSTSSVENNRLLNHDWLRALRMTTYGFFIYGPASQVWYSFLDHMFWQKTLRNLSLKVALNQVILGPFVIAVVFAWNSIWQGKLDKLPALYHEHAVSTLVDGWKFWIPASVVNFGLIPLQARVAFMSSCSIFWNFYLSTTMGKA